MHIKSLDWSEMGWKKLLILLLCSLIGCFYNEGQSKCVWGVCGVYPTNSMEGPCEVTGHLKN